MQNGIDYGKLVQPDAIHGRLFYDPAIYEEEMAKIFGRTWIYVGHESEVPEPGDFITRKIGLQPVIMVRGKDQRVRLFLNRCRHRANTVCLAERGKASGGFRCIYHGWTYSNTGELVGVPYPEGFDPRDFNKADFPLAEVALESYRGFAFGNLNPQQDLESFLGRAAMQVIDLAVDQSPVGEVEVRGTALKHVFNANWKIGMDNTIDAYHVQVLHKTALEIGPGKFVDWTSVYGSGEGAAQVRDLGHGHAQLDMVVPNSRSEGFVVPGVKAPVPSADEVAHEEALAKRVGKQRAHELLLGGNPLMTLFPTFSFIPPGEIRMLQPAGQFRTEVYYYAVLLKGVPRSVNVERIRRESFMHGPAGVVTGDDIDMFERSQEALNARKEEWLILRRGLRSEVHEEGGTVLGRAHDETSNRSLWRQYRQLMTAD